MKNIIAALEKYVNKRYAPGGFLTAVLENDLVRSCGRADEHNRELLFDIVSYVYNNIPSVCWGSREKVDKWLHGGDENKSAVDLPKYYLINGYWKDGGPDDTFEDYIVKSTEEVIDSEDDTIFFYGLDSGLLQELAAAGDSTSHDFVITSYKELK